MTTNLEFWIPVLGVPILALMANIIVRLVSGLPQSAVPDFILCFVVFDAIVAIQHDEFQKFIRIDSLSSAVEAVYVSLLFGSLVAWFVVVTQIEHRILASHASGFTFSGLMWLLISGVIATMIIFLSVAPFAYRV